MIRKATHPGIVLLEEFLKPLRLTQVEAAHRSGVSMQRMNGLVRGKRRVTADTAFRLAKLLDTSAEFWVNLQTQWDLHCNVNVPIDLIDRHIDERVCMIAGCGRRALYRNPLSAKTQGTQRGYCSAHRHMAVTAYSQKVGAAQMEWEISRGAYE